MATNDCTPVEFLDIYANAFYFKGYGKDEDVDEDAPGGVSQHFIRSSDNKFLILNDNKFEMKNLTVYEQSQPECKFNIRLYKNHTNEDSGRVAMLYCNKDGKTMVACCSENEIYPVAMDIPNEFNEDQRKAVFILRGIPAQTNRYMFESYMYKNKFMGFDTDKNNPSLDKLVLRNKVEEVDRSCQMILSSQKKQPGLFQ